MLQMSVLMVLHPLYFCIGMPVCMQACDTRVKQGGGFLQVCSASQKHVFEQGCITDLLDSSPQSWSFPYNISRVIRIVGTYFLWDVYLTLPIGTAGMRFFAVSLIAGL